MGSECRVLFLVGHAVVFSREMNVWLSVKECLCVICQLLHWLIKLLCAGLSESQEHTYGVSLSQLGR